MCVRVVCVFFNFFVLAITFTISPLLLFLKFIFILFLENFLNSFITSKTDKPLPYPQFNVSDLFEAFIFDKVLKCMSAKSQTCI